MSDPEGPRKDLILVVDDDRDIARFVEMNLRLQGFDVAVANGGEEAFELVTRLHPDLAIIDLMMPGMDGLELTRKLRANPFTSSIPIIMLTARGQTVDKVRTARRSANSGHLELRVEVDGGIGEDTIEQAALAGADAFVAGTAVYSAADPAAAVRALRRQAEHARGGGAP